MLDTEGRATSSRNDKSYASAGLVAVIAFMSAFCGPYVHDARSQSATPCEKHAIDLGGKTVMGGCSALRIAFLTAGTNGLYVQAGIKGATEAAAKIGATLDVFDPSWSPTTQFNQVQNILASGKYDAIVAEMNDGNQSCPILSQAAPDKGVIVSVANLPICGRASNEGDETWAPGTLNFVGGWGTPKEFTDYFMSLAAENPGPQKVAVLTGPELNANTLNTKIALDAVREKYPDFDVIGIVPTDYSLLQGNQKAVPLLQANPDMTMIVGGSADITRGIVQAAKQVGATAKLKIHDIGGSQWSFEAVRQGVIESSWVLPPYDEMHEAVMSIKAVWDGEAPKRFVALKAVRITAANIDQHKPQF